MPALAHHVKFEGTHGSARWEGCAVGDADAFRAFVRGPVWDRVRDAESEDPFASELHGLATTGMATEFLEGLLRATPEPMGWEIGEALAECVLEQDSSREVCWYLPVPISRWPALARGDAP